MKKKGVLRIKFGKTIHRKTGFMNRKEGSGRPRSVATDLIEELIC